MNGSLFSKSMRRHSAYMEYQRTGKVPQGKQPRGPLVDMLQQIGPRWLGTLRGVVIDERLGYIGYRVFSYGSQALRWVAPDNEVFGSFPAESWRNKRFQKKLYLDDVLECCASYPENITMALRHLMRPTPTSELISEPPPV